MSPARDNPEHTTEALLTRAFGPYECQAVLGRGGMGIVLMGVDPVSGAKAAIKTLAAPNPHRMRHLRREIRLLRRIRHPGVVAFLEDGVEAGMPWYAMALLEGETLSHHIARTGAESPGAMLTTFSAPSTDDMWTKSLPTKGSAWAHTPAARGKPEERRQYEGEIERLVGVTCQIARTLSFLHGEGIVHGDLKPSNVVLTDDGRVVLVDFGLASERGARTSTSNLADAGLLMGSSSYISPERIVGRGIDGRHDLYALGCVLFEIVTGQCFFHYDNLNITLQAHKTVRPPRLSSMVGGVPKALDDLVGSLLEKDPARRPGQTRSVVRALEDITKKRASFPAGAPCLHEPGLLGRQDQVAAFGAILDDLVEGKGQAFVLSGKSGVGKSRLAQEFVGMARAVGVSVFLGHSDDPQVNPSTAPLSAFRGILRALADKLLAQTEGVEVPARILRTLLPHAPFLSELPHIDEPLAPPRLSPLDTQHRVAGAVLEVMEACVGTGPVAVVLDDLQWADPLARLALDRCLAQVGRRPWLFMGVVRSDEPCDALQAIFSNRGVDLHHIGPLAPKDIDLMVRGMLGVDEVPEGLSEFVKRNARGNPFFAGECIRAALQQGALFMHPDHERWHFDEDVLASSQSPQEPLDLIAGRLEILKDDERAVALAVVMLGQHATRTSVAEVTQLSHTEIGDALTTLFRLVVLVEDQEEPDRVRFAHGTLADVVSKSFSEAAKRAYHRRTAVWLGEGASPNDIELQCTLGRHWAEAGEDALAFEANIRAAELAADAGALQKAEDLLRACLVLDLRPAQHHDARLMLAERVLHIQARFDEMKSTLEPLASAENLDAARRARALCLRSDMRRLVSDNAGALQLAEEAVALCRQASLVELEIEALYRVGYLHFLESRHEASQSHYQQALAQCRAHRLRRLEGKMLGAMAVMETYQGHFTKAHELSREALALQLDIGDGIAAAGTLVSIARIHYENGRHNEASQVAQEGYRLHKAQGNNIVAAEAINLVGLALRHLGRFEEALATFDEGISIVPEHPAMRIEGVLTSNIGATLHDLGRLDEAMVRFEAALRIHRVTNNRRSQGIVLGNMANIALDQERPDRCIELSREAREIHREVANRIEEGAVCGSMANAYFALGDTDRALELSDGAIEILAAGSFTYHTVMVSIYRARMHRLLGDPEQARSWLLKDAERLEGSGFEYESCLQRCELGHLALAEGEDPSAHLQRARTCLASLALPPTSEPALKVAALERAISARDKGERLRFGEMPEDLPARSREGSE